jgi:hypothetical protein
MMKRALRTMLMMAALPLAALAQGFGDLDQATANLSRGFGGGEARAIVAGLGESDKVQLQFPGLIDETGFFGRDQASYMLEKLFRNVSPSGYARKRERGVKAENQFRIEADWTISREGRTEVVPLYLTLQKNGERWVLVSARSASK